MRGGSLKSAFAPVRNVTHIPRLMQLSDFRVVDSSPISPPAPPIGGRGAMRGGGYARRFMIDRTVATAMMPSASSQSATINSIVPR